jgi:hypothetical protein
MQRSYRARKSAVVKVEVVEIAVAADGGKLRRE